MMNPVLGSIEKGASLKHVEVNDRAAPVIEPIQLKENPFKKVASDLNLPHELKHIADINDKSAPVIEPDIQIKENGHAAVMSEIVSKSK